MQRLIRPIGLVVAAAIIGYVLARSGHSTSHGSTAALDRTASTAAFAVRYPSGWRKHAVGSPPGLKLDDPVAFGPSSPAGERLSIGTVQVATVGTLPAAFLGTLAQRPRPATVQLGAYRFDRYLDLRPRGSTGATSVYLLATTRSTIAAACAAPRPGSAFTSQCERVLATLRLPAGTSASPGVDAAYALELNSILGTLNDARSSAGPGLRAVSLATRARAAERLAAAEQKAASAAGRLSAGSAAPANRMLVRALREAAPAYRALATAATKGDRAGYATAQRRLGQAQRTLTEAFKRLAQLGYRLR